MKLNNLTSYKIVDKFYEASRAGVPAKLMIRGICCLIPGVKNMSENIEVIGVVDRFLEHSRLYIFENAGDPSMYISSADMMTRNIENRVEVACPIYAKDLQKQILDAFEIGWNDNCKGRRINGKVQNVINTNGQKPLRSQEVLFQYTQTLVNNAIR